MLGEAESLNSQAVTSGGYFSLIDINITYANTAVRAWKYPILEYTLTDDRVFAEVEYCCLISLTFRPAAGRIIVLP